jgi:single-stranded DNA-binding protein
MPGDCPICDEWTLLGVGWLETQPKGKVEPMGQAYLEVGGRLARDAEQRTTKAGKQMLKFSIPVDSSSGQGQKHTAWYSILVLGDLVEQWRGLRKGDEIEVAGPLSTREWTTKEGTKRVELEVFADAIRRPNGQDMPSAPPEGPDVDEADLPF